MKEMVNNPMEVENVNTEEEAVVIDTDEVVETPAPDEVAETPQPTMLDLPTAINTVIARTEATAIVVSAINAFLDVLQQREHPLSTEELAKIQIAINAETSKTDALYHEIEKVLAASANSAPADTADMPESAE